MACIKCDFVFCLQEKRFDPLIRSQIIQTHIHNFTASFSLFLGMIYILKSTKTLIKSNQFSSEK